MLRERKGSTLCFICMTLIGIALSLALRVKADELPSYSVTVAAPRETRVVTPDELRMLCGPQTNGCTHVMGTTLHTDCVAHADGWRMSPSVSFVPFVYVGVQGGAERIFEHEMNHIADIEASLEMHVRHLANERFSSIEQCRESATIEQNRIERITRQFARESFEVRR
jgi:hypothetical protein